MKTATIKATTRTKKANRVIGNVLSTTDYDQFKFVVGNRPISVPHLNRIVLSMKKKYLPTVAIVNEKYEVIDGQHRLMACQELGLEYPFMICRGLTVDDIARYNAHTENWTVQTHFDSYVKRGFPEYLALQDLMYSTRTSLSLVRRLMTGDQKTIGERIKDGTLTLVKKDNTSIRKKMSRVNKLRDVVDIKFKESLLKALCDVQDIKEVEWAIMSAKFIKYHHKMNPVNCILDFIVELEKLYNFGRSVKVPVSILNQNRINETKFKPGENRKK